MREKETGSKIFPKGEREQEMEEENRQGMAHKVPMYQLPTMNIIITNYKFILIVILSSNLILL